jgi:DNA invertase Pin-like site-specific DNA recombinase
MNGSDKIDLQHRERRAFVYARQSTAAQVLQHRSSTERQIELTETAVKLGWPQSHVELVADDLGRSGKFSEGRDGFQRLTAEVSLGHVGAVLSLDASRLARSSADWHRLLEIAALTRTLLIDEQTVYDPSDPNDRLILGMKGTMADFELQWLRHRMEGGRWHLARKGEFRVRPPIGYVYEDEESTTLTMDPDEEVRRAVALLFERYRAGGTCADVVRHFTNHALRFPARFSKRLVWHTLTVRRVGDVLKNPLYTGAYVYGRSRTETVLDGGLRRRRTRSRSMSDWPVMLRDAHPAYISWEDFLANRKRMSENSPRRPGDDGRGAVREGSALLQGLLMCGRCSQRVYTRYCGQNGRYASYLCQRLQNQGLDDGCLHTSARVLEEPVVGLLFQVITREHLERATRVVEIIEQQDAALEQQWRLRLERARYDAKRAERQYDACDPDNRVVASTLEKRWNDRLVELEQLEGDYEEVRKSRRLETSDVERQRILQLADDLPRLWQATTTSDRDRKLLLRLLFQQISVRPVDVPRRALRVQVLWHSQAVSELEIEKPRRGESRGRIRYRILSTVAPQIAQQQTSRS